MLAWATATFWFPLMIAIGVWRHVVRRVPLRYHPSYWSMVFPLGMYGAATFRMRAAIELEVLAWLPKVALAVALLAWPRPSSGSSHARRQPHGSQRSHPRSRAEQLRK